MIQSATGVSRQPPENRFTRSILQVWPTAEEMMEPPAFGPTIMNIILVRSYLTLSEIEWKRFVIAPKCPK